MQDLVDFTIIVLFFLLGDKSDYNLIYLCELTTCITVIWPIAYGYSSASIIYEFLQGPRGVSGQKGSKGPAGRPGLPGTLGNPGPIGVRGAIVSILLFVGCCRC